MVGEKPKVIGEVFDEAMIRSFLDYKALDDQYTDFHILTKAYRGLPLEAFESFVAIYVSEGHDINAGDPQGVSFYDSIKSNSAQLDYLSVLKKHGADS